ncbi:MAG: succinylglutamate desuccinylase/aspartoacylase family protein [Ktedonobacterales bacterium]
MRVGTCEAKLGRMSYGWLEAFSHFDGTPERLPVVIACGRQDGPCLWVTGNIHGDEYVGLLAVQNGVTQGLAKRLRDLHGTVVAIPSLNPAGLRVGRRQPYYDPTTDPNRTFPDADASVTATESDDDDERPTPYTAVSEQFFAALRASATYLIDLHAMDIQATPFTIRDHVLYRGEEQRAAAEQLSRQLDGLARAFGIPIVNEYTAKKYLKQKLHRSTAGAALHVAGIPAITPELGMGGDVEPLALRAGVAGIHNALVWAQMLPDDPIAVDWIPQPDLGYSVRREPHPRAPLAGIVHKRVRPGEIVRAGDVVADLRDIWGRPLGDDNGQLRAEKDGWVLSMRSGIGVYPQQAIMDLAVRDDDPLVEPWPEA